MTAWQIAKRWERAALLLLMGSFLFLLAAAILLYESA
jgi:hypothetical protein